MGFDAAQLSSISKTLLIPLYMRWLESKEKNPIIVDAQLESVVSNISFKFESLAGRENMQAGIAARTKLVDDVAQSFIERQNGPHLIAHLGCGLDPRVGRLKTKPSTRWIDVDLPKVIDWRKAIFPDLTSEQMKGDFRGFSLKNQKRKGESCLIIVEGLLCYFQKEEVAGFLRSLETNVETEVVFDTISTSFDRFVGGDRFSDLVSGQKEEVDSADYRWFVDAPGEIEALTDSIRVIESTSIFNLLGARVSPRLDKALSLFPVMKNACCVVHASIAFDSSQS
jgi:O-methyltransferase involved in polyketide biosynthesis